MAYKAQKPLLGLQLQELAALVEELEQPSYRAHQLFEALYQQRVESTDHISTLPRDFRCRLRELGITIGAPGIQRKFASNDGTVRYLLA